MGSNVAPVLHGGDYVEDDPAKLDHDRDPTVMPLIRAALRAGVSILGACRGMKEPSVALGGTSGRALGVQWHLEWHTKLTPLHATLLDALGRACTARAERAER
jgi:gamma-glutamyl-gamma-aminobutyrate hydrolase PuuD